MGPGTGATGEHRREQGSKEHLLAGDQLQGAPARIMRRRATTALRSERSEGTQAGRRLQVGCQGSGCVEKRSRLGAAAAIWALDGEALELSIVRFACAKYHIVYTLSTPSRASPALTSIFIALCEQLCSPSCLATS